ncbi:MAG: SDR family NAD(P)-dependent oxidoreductase [Cyclobacteriaceae bacterium]|nr:SDR family NAD(P)-dependent oxidoreductase [Cyclobacteriaceae bacterium]
MSKLAVVTGGTKGIGRAIIEKFASEKFDIVTCSRKPDELAACLRHLESAYQVKAYGWPTDMSMREQVKSFTQSVNNLGRPIDVLVNNAGFFTPGEVTKEAEGTLESMIDANVYSAYHATRGLVEGMKARRSGHIINMCSIASIKAYPNGGSYAISKFALLGFSKVLREELKEFGIRVTAVLPGATRTSSWDGIDLPEERFMKPEDVADAIFSAYSLSTRSVVEEILIRPQLGDI